MTKLQTLLIDDEPPALTRLRRLLLPYADQLSICGEATNGAEGVALIEQLRPDVVFLDIHLPELNGFELLGQLTHLPFIVFTTAYDHYAVRAFEEQAVDYLVKPIEASRLAKTMQKVAQVRQEAAIGLSTLQKILSDWQSPTPVQAITVPVGDHLLVVPLSDIAYFSSSGKHVVVHRLSNEQHVVNYTLTDLGNQLGNRFIRVSRSHLVNSAVIDEIRKWSNGSYTLTLRDAKRSAVNTSTHCGDLLSQLRTL